MIETRVHEEIFEAFPSFRRGVVLAKNMQNKGGSRELESMLLEALDGAAKSPVDLKGDSRTSLWYEAYRSLGCNPNKYPPAHLALLKRIQRPGARIPFVNRAVSIMNYNSIRGVLPVGGDDVLRAGKTLTLRIADGKEQFTPLGSPEREEHPYPGEMIYVVSETGEVMCRRWNWRNSYKTRITEETRAMVMNIDGLGEGNEERTIAVRDRVARMLVQFCAAEVETALLEPVRPFHRFSL